MRKGRLVLIVAVLALALIAWAWADGGREPLHEISQPIPAPEVTP